MNLFAWLAELYDSREAAISPQRAAQIGIRADMDTHPIERDDYPCSLRPPTILTNGDYKLADGHVWLEVGGFAIRVYKTDEGVVCDVYKSGMEDGDTLASCYAFDSELEEL